MSSCTTVIKLAFSHEWKVLLHALKTYPSFEVEEIANASEAATYLSSVSSALVFIALRKKEDLIQIASLIKLYKKVAPDTVIKLSVVNFSGERNYEKTIAKLGIQDIIDPNINTRALRYKVDFWIKGLNAQLMKNEAALATKTVQKCSSETIRPGQRAQDMPTWDPPLDCVDDFWLIKSEVDCKRALGKWFIRITGPGPYVAQWTEVNGKSNLWKFQFRKEDRDSFHDEDGSWFFKGEQKPDFQWKDNVWMITGNQFDLYYQDFKNIKSRMSSHNKTLNICKNSEYARTKEIMVLGSFDKEIIIKRDGNIQTNQQLDAEGGTDRLKNLEGKGRTEKMNSAPLSGTTNGTDDLGSGLLAMDLQPGKNKLDGGPLLGLENRDSEHKKHWKGHNEADRFSAGPLSGHQWKAQEFESDQKKQKGAFAGEMSGNLSGKSHTDNLNSQDKNHGRKKNEVRFRSGHLSEMSEDNKDNALDHDKDIFAEDEAGYDNLADAGYLNKHKLHNERERKTNIASLEDARNLKNLQKVLEEDPDLDMATQSPEILSFLFINDEKVNCKLDDFFDKSIFISTKGKKITGDSEVVLDLSLNYLKKVSKLNFKGKVTETVDDEEGYQYVTIEIPDEVMKAFDNFMKLYQIRQKNINFFLRKVKGL